MIYSVDYCGDGSSFLRMANILVATIITGADILILYKSWSAGGP